MGGTIEAAALKLSRRQRFRLLPWLPALLPVAAVFLMCYRPVMRLKPQPPPGFVETRESWDALRHSSENRAAQAYYQLAINLVQERYAFGSKLPLEPIEGFRLNEKNFPRNSVAAAPATQIRYWNKLRQIWSQPSAWSQTYVWNTDWLRDSLSSLVDAVSRLSNAVVDRIKSW